MEVPTLLDELAARDARHDLSGALTRSAREDVARRYARIWQRTLRVFPDVTETLARLRRAGVRVIGWTDSALVPTSARLRIAGLEDAFDLVLCSGSCRQTTAHALLPIAGGRAHARARSAVDCVKGAAATLVDVLTMAGTTPDRALVVGDHFARDVRPAVDAGVRARWARYGLRRRASDLAWLDALAYWPAAPVTREPDVTADPRAPFAIDSLAELAPIDLCHARRIRRW